MILDLFEQITVFSGLVDHVQDELVEHGIVLFENRWIANVIDVLSERPNPVVVCLVDLVLYMVFLPPVRECLRNFVLKVIPPSITRLDLREVLTKCQIELHFETSLVS